MIEWSLDICGCTLNLEGEELSFKTRCEYHSGLNFSVEQVKAEHDYKNSVINSLHSITYFDPDMENRPKVTLTWSWDEDRKIHIQLSGRDADTVRDAVQESLENDFGSTVILD